MEKLTRILVKQIIDSELAVSSDRADILFVFLKDVLERNEKIELSFESIDFLLTVFVNDSIGKLYEYFPADQIENIVIVNAEKSILDTIERVKRKSREFYNK